MDETAAIRSPPASRRPGGGAIERTERESIEGIGAGADVTETGGTNR